MTQPRTAAANTAKQRDHAVVLFDGVCNLCNGFVNFVIDHDPNGYFRFAALQSDVAVSLLGADVSLPRDGGMLQSVVLVEDGQVYRKSTAALRIVRRFTGLWPLLAALVIVPRPLRDAFYDWIAGKRYAWFGKRDRCRVPTPELQDRFVG